MWLPERNNLMRAGLTERASAMSVKIGAGISEHNAGLLKDAAITDVGGRSDSTRMWRLVREVTVHFLSYTPPSSPSLTAELINSQFSKVSTDLNYSLPPPKLSCQNFIALLSLFLSPGYSS